MAERRKELSDRQREAKFHLVAATGSGSYVMDEKELAEHKEIFDKPGFEYAVYQRVPSASDPVAVGDIGYYDGPSTHEAWQRRFVTKMLYMVTDTYAAPDHVDVHVQRAGAPYNKVPNNGWVQDDWFVCSAENFHVVHKVSYIKLD